MRTWAPRLGTGRALCDARPFRCLALKLDHTGEYQSKICVVNFNSARIMKQTFSGSTMTCNAHSNHVAFPSYVRHIKGGAVVKCIFRWKLELQKRRRQT